MQCTTHNRRSEGHGSMTIGPILGHSSTLSRRTWFCHSSSLCAASGEKAKLRIKVRYYFSANVSIPELLHLVHDHTNSRVAPFNNCLAGRSVDVPHQTPVFRERKKISFQLSLGSTKL